VRLARWVSMWPDHERNLQLGYGHQGIAVTRYKPKPLREKHHDYIHELGAFIDIETSRHQPALFDLRGIQTAGLPQTFSLREIHRRCQRQGIETPALPIIGLVCRHHGSPSYGVTEGLFPAPRDEFAAKPYNSESPFSARTV
jgi:hypothetical protein